MNDAIHNVADAQDGGAINIGETVNHWKTVETFAITIFSAATISSVGTLHITPNLNVNRSVQLSNKDGNPVVDLANTDTAHRTIDVRSDVGVINVNDQDFGKMQQALEDLKGTVARMEQKMDALPTKDTFEKEILKQQLAEINKAANKRIAIWGIAIPAAVTLVVFFLTLWLAK